MRLFNVKSFVFIVIFVVLPIGWMVNAQNQTPLLPVYEEADDTDYYFWQPSGWMPNGEGIAFNASFEENCHRGATCIEAGFDTTQKNSWVGIYWLANDSWEGPGVNIYEELGVNAETPIKLTFWARGNTGEEKVQFKVGGVSKAKDSLKFPVATEYIKLKQTWEQYSIDLSNKDLSKVAGGFCWVTDKAHNKGKDEVLFYLDDIQYEVIPPSQ